MLRPEVRVVTVIPIAIALVEIIATRASPFTEEFPLTFKRRIAEIMEIGREIKRGERFSARAIATVPNPRWESPSPIIENLFKTRITPKRAAQREMRLPAINALVIKLYVKMFPVYSFKFSIFFIFVSFLTVPGKAFVKSGF